MKIVKDIKALKTISAEELRKYDGLADVSEEEANHIIEALKELSLITYNIVTKYDKSKSISNFRKAK